MPRDGADATDLELEARGGRGAAHGERHGGARGRAGLGRSRATSSRSATDDERAWLVLDDAVAPVDRRASAVREVASIVVLCELAGELAGGGELEELRAQLAEAADDRAARRGSRRPRRRRSRSSGRSARRRGRLARLPRRGRRARHARLEEALGEHGSPFASALAASAGTVEAFVAEVETRATSCPCASVDAMEGGGFGFPFGGDPEDLLRGLREFAEQQAESVQEAQREQFATLTLNTAVELTSAALSQMQVAGTARRAGDRPPRRDARALPRGRRARQRSPPGLHARTRLTPGRARPRREARATASPTRQATLRHPGRRGSSRAAEAVEAVVHRAGASAAAGRLDAATLTWPLLRFTNIGRQIYALGGNKDAAQRLGFHVVRLNFLVYGYLGFVAGIASLVQAQLAQSVTPTVLVGKELDVLAAVVLGGASLTGGVGTVFGAILGVTLLAILQNGLVLLGVSSYWNQWFVGLTILCAVSITAWRSAGAAPPRRSIEGMSG